MNFQDHASQIASKLSNLESLWKISDRVPNQAQLQAIYTVDGPLLIIAGPGSGKTFTLVDRVVYLATEKGKQPENLMVVTFTEKAASELVTRISDRMIAIGVRFNLNEMYLGTFHSICLRWLEEYREFTRLKRNFTMMDQFDQQYFVFQNIREYEKIPNIQFLIGKPENSSWGKTKELVKWLNTATEEYLDAEELKNARDESVCVLGRALEIYQRHLEEANALDFATIQYEALKLLRNQPKARDELRQRISHIMVDEYQDTNSIQERILFELLGKEPNLCVVGDDDQGLYRFRGATIRNILQFKDNFEKGRCQQIDLFTNYRSHPDIIHFYNQWIQGQDWDYKGNHYRFDKDVVTPEGQQFPSVPGVVKVSGQTQDDYHREVLDFLHALRDKGNLKDWNQVAFLFRSVKNEKVVALAHFLEQNGIPVYSPRSNQFFEREEIRLMIGAFIFLFPQFERARQWKEGFHLSIWDYYDLECYLPFTAELRKPENKELRDWASAMGKVHASFRSGTTDYAFSGLFYRLLQFPLFSSYLNDDLMQGKMRDMRAMRNLALFSSLLRKVEYLQHINVFSAEHLDDTLRQLFNLFLRFLMEGGLDEYEDEAEYAPSGSVSFLTIHQSKGLQFPVVVVGSLEAGPRKQYSDLTEILEQGYLDRPAFEPLSEIKYYDFRRLFYTAFSRAQNLLVLATHEHEGHQSSPSKYFRDYYSKLPSWRSSKFEPKKLPLAEIKDIDLKKEYSFTSAITVYENCAEQYRFFRALEFVPIRTAPILFGTVIHQTIEDIHKTVLRGETEKLSHEQVQFWFEVNYANLTKRERVYLDPYRKNQAMEHVLRYYHRNGSDWSHIREAEVDVSLVKDDYILTGTVDLITGQDGTVELVDFKSEKKPDVNNPEDREKLDRYRRQLEVYAHIVQERTGQQVSKTHLYYTSEETGNPRITYDKDTRSINNTIRTFDNVVHRIESKDFAIPARPAKLCRDCDIRYYCDRKNWKFRSQA
jgi:DNA helicase II / ATP-dependent DNA helicase PcrA